MNYYFRIYILDWNNIFAIIFSLDVYQTVYSVPFCHFGFGSSRLDLGPLTNSEILRSLFRSQFVVKKYFKAPKLKKIEKKQNLILQGENESKNLSKCLEIRDFKKLGTKRIYKQLSLLLLKKFLPFLNNPNILWDISSIFRKISINFPKFFIHSASLQNTFQRLCSKKPFLKTIFIIKFDLGGRKCQDINL